MSMVRTPIPTFFDLDGSPLESGYVYIGTTGLDARTNPIQVYWDSALTQTAAQPIRTLAGYPAYQGAPAQIYVAQSAFRVTVLDRRQLNVFENKEMVAFDTAGTSAALQAALAASSGSSLVGFIQSGTGAVARTAQAKMRDTVSVKDFGATGDGVADDTAEIQAALDSGHRCIYFDDGTYLVSAMLTTPMNVKLIGSHNQRAGLKLASGAANNTDILTLGYGGQVEDLFIEGNWDQVTAGQLGRGIVCKDPSLLVGRYHRLKNVAIRKCKSYGLYVYEGAYNDFDVIVDTNGLDDVYFEGASTASFTSTRLRGTLSTTPNGYGLRIKNGLNLDISIISEGTKGIALEGNHRGLDFHDCYFETPVAATPYIFNTISGGGTNFSIRQCYLGMAITTAVWQHDANYTGIIFEDNQNNTTKPLTGSAGYSGGYSARVTGRTSRQRGGEAILASSFATVGNVGAGEDTLYTTTIGGNTLNVDGEAIRVKAWGKTAANANTKTVKIKFGGTTIVDTTAIAANNKDWLIDVIIGRIGASSQSAGSSGSFNGAILAPNNSTPAINLANDAILLITGEATSDNDVTITGCIVELIDAQPASF